MKAFPLHIICFLLFLFAGNSFVFSQRPFIIYNPVGDTIIKEPEHNRQDFLLDSLFSRTNQFRWARELQKIIIVAPDRKDKDTISTGRSFVEFLPYSGKTIRKIEFIRLDPFGTSLDDLSWVNVNSLTKFGNTIHFKTLERVLKRNLILKEGDEINPYLLADNERLFRQLKYVEDARILVMENELEPEFVDIVVLTKDIWSKAFFIELDELDEGSIGLWDRNIFGTGNDFENNIHWNPNKSEFWGYDAIYKSRNILGTFINTNLFYQNVFETESYGLGLNRSFFTPSIKYAGGFSIEKTRTKKEIWYSKSLQTTEPLSYSMTDAWIGRSIALRDNYDYKARRLNLVLAARLIHHNFTVRPLEVSENLFHEYHNNTLWLNSVSLSAQGYHKSNLIYSFGRTEDIPNGWNISLTMGKEFSEFADRLYSSFHLSHGDFHRNFGYLYASIAGGTYIDEGNYEQGVTCLDVNYFTNLFILGRYKFRHFINIEHLRGYNRFDLERININDKNGIRGLTQGSVFGQQKLSLNMETVVFSPAIPYGFRIAFFGFSDFALIGEQNESFRELDSYTGIGFGIRIRNERLVFPTFQFRFAFYPGLNNIDPIDYFQFSGEKKLNPEDFASGAPEIVGF